MAPRKEMLVMPNYGLRSKPVLEADRPDQPIGSFPNRAAALNVLNEAGDGHESGAAQLESGPNNDLCPIKYHLVETLNGKRVSHPLFPKDLRFDPMKTTNGKGLFQR
jgi:hypothetical protein